MAGAEGLEPSARGFGDTVSFRKSFYSFRPVWQFVDNSDFNSVPFDDLLMIL